VSVWANVGQDVSFFTKQRFSLQWIMHFYHKTWFINSSFFIKYCRLVWVKNKDLSYFFGMALWLSWELPGTKKQFSLFVYIYPKNAIFWKFFIDIGEDKKSIWGFKSYNLFSTAFRKVQSKIISPYSLVRLNKNMTNLKNLSCSLLLLVFIVI